MPATLLNAPARLPLTGLIALILSIAALSAALALGGSRAGTAAAAPGRPEFARRMVTLPAVVVTAPDTTDGLVVGP